jgi:hypothetical protein
MSVLFWNKAGPRIAYTADGALKIDDLNPEQHMRWTMTRWELHKLGWCMIWASIVGR